LPEAVGAEMTDRRVRAGFSQQTLAERLGYDVNYIGQIERAEKSPTLTTLISICGAFEIKVSDFMRAAEKRLASRRS
jgi:transcriptional regulator with XRE-family HTH domain